MSKTQKALRLALEALEESLGYVEKEAENAQRLYGQYPTRQARIQGLKDDARKHMDAITAIREALAEQPAQQEPVEEFAYKAITKRGEHCHFGTHAAARIWAGEGGEVETIKLRHLELVEQPAQPSKPWVGLTEQERNDLEDYCEMIIGKAAFEAIEAKLREKNA